MLISRTHVPAPHPSMPQTNKLVKAAASQALSWHTCWGWAMETWGDRWGASEKKCPGKAKHGPSAAHACVCVCMCSVCTWMCLCRRLEPSLVWQRSAGRNWANHSNSRALVRRAKHREGHKLFLLPKYGSDGFWVYCSKKTHKSSKKTRRGACSRAFPFFLEAFRDRRSSQGPAGIKQQRFLILWS